VPIHFTVNPAQRLVRYTVEGVATEQEARAFLAAAVARPDFEPGFYFLGEARGDCVPHSAYTAVIARVCREWAEHLAPCKWAVVAAYQAGRVLVQRQAQEWKAEGVEVAPFRTEAGATDWLAACRPVADAS
jgi:hypothetical protein